MKYKQLDQFAYSLDQFELLNDLVALEALDWSVPSVLDYPQKILSFPLVVKELEGTGPSVLLKEAD